jgi:hypothetical protein
MSTTKKTAYPFERESLWKLDSAILGQEREEFRAQFKKLSRNLRRLIINLCEESVRLEKIDSPAQVRDMIDFTLHLFNYHSVINFPTDKIKRFVKELYL